METSLHRDLKALYARPGSKLEATVGPYRIDVADRGRLVEIQSASLAAIRDKVRKLLQTHRVVVVKPIVARKRLVKRAAKGGPVIQQRLSPKRGQLLDAFHELVYFTQVFPHPRLTLELLLVDVEEWRYPGHGRRRRWRRHDFVVEDQKLLAVRGSLRLRTAADLRELLNGPLPQPFHTGHLAESLGVSLWHAQRIAYCLRRMGAVREVGKQRNRRLYAFPTRAPARRAG